MIWLVFAYGMLIYKLEGVGPERNFCRSFGVGIGIKVQPGGLKRFRR